MRLARVSIWKAQRMQLAVGVCISQLTVMEETKDSIEVIVRIRDALSQSENGLSHTDNGINIDRHYYRFDRVFGPNCTQKQVYSHIGSRLIENTFQGFNGCVFVYGQTGSGKTYTMIGNQQGLMQRTFKGIFDRIEQLKQAEISVSCSYLQIYNEQLFDLLQPMKKKKLTIRQDSKKGVFVENLNQTSVDCQETMLSFLRNGLKNRHVGQTDMNRQSSRSHAIFLISIYCKSSTADGTVVVKSPKLYLVDLAGSERQKSTGAAGSRLKEANNINKSLTTLGMVINTLSSKKAKSHISFRDSKLTNILQDSLGGNSKTVMIATVSSSLKCTQQTLSTLNFASRVKLIPLNAQINQKSIQINYQSFQFEIQRLKEEILFLKANKQTQNNPPTPKFEQLQQNLRQRQLNIEKNSSEKQAEQLMQQLRKKDQKLKAFQERFRYTQKLEYNRFLGRVVDYQQNSRKSNSKKPRTINQHSQNSIWKSVTSHKASVRKDSVCQLGQKIALKDLQIQCSRSIFQVKCLQYQKLIGQNEKQICHLMQTIDKLRQETPKTTENQKVVELEFKISYYESKFKLMSSEYKKAKDILKIFRHKELQQNRPIHNLREVESGVLTSNPNAVNQDQSTHHSNISFHSPRKSLKKSLNKQNQEPGNMMMFNFSSKKSDCEDSVQHSLHSTRKEERLKAFNEVIMKQNLYLRERIRNLQSQMSSNEGEGQKRIKPNEKE